MATVHFPKTTDQEGVARAGEPMARPYVVLRDGKVMSYKEWTDSGQPA